LKTKILLVNPRIYDFADVRPSWSGTGRGAGPMRGTESWRALVREGLITDDLNLLLTNNTVFSSLYSGYDEGEVTRLKLAVKEYNARSG
jgi:hypothetical protein